MGSREKNTSQEENANTSGWMVTFSDLIMLLLTFFVLLLTMSSLDQKAIKELISHLQGSTGVLEFSGFGEVASLASFVKNYNTIDSKIIISHEKLVALCLPTLEAAKKIQKNTENIGDLIKISDDERGISLSFHENLFFEPGMTTIKKENYAFLDTVALAINDCPNDILIMGHTDSKPAKKGTYQSNLDLSAYRGMAVLEYFINKKNLDPERLAVGGYGSFRPLNPNEHQIGKSTNRRVEIIFKPLREI
jgi:chemotaxis protein MotB